MLLSLFQESALFALDPDRPLSHYPVKVFRSELRSRIIYHVRQSHDGYLWLATEDGLARFDGARITYFDHVSTREITHDYVSGIATSESRGLIAGFGDGSILEAGERGIRRLARTGGEGGSQPHSLLEDSRGRIWAGTDLGLFLIEDGRDLDHRSDLYSLAAVFYEALTGRRLVPAGEFAEICMHVVGDEPVPISKFLPAIPVSVDLALLAALAKDPRKRPDTVDRWVASFVTDLESAPPTVSGWFGTRPRPAGGPGATEHMKTVRLTPG